MLGFHKNMHNKFNKMIEGRGNPLHHSVRAAHAIHEVKEDFERIERSEKNLIRKERKY